MERAADLNEPSTPRPAVPSSKVRRHPASFVPDAVRGSRADVMPQTMLTAEVFRPAEESLNSKQLGCFPHPSVNASVEQYG